MKNKKIISILALSFLYLGILWPQISNAQENIDPLFNPNNIISDQEFLNYQDFNLKDIQNFLQKNNSFLLNYATRDNNGQIKSAAEIIYDATHNNYDCDNADLNANSSWLEKNTKCKHITTVNPKVLLVLLQKEQGLIENTGPSPRQLDWATGYGCPDNWVCNPYYKGFGKQVNSAALQFLNYIKHPNHYNYQVGESYLIHNTLRPYLDSSKKTMLITPKNKATAALYDYTPHVFNGNYNFYKLWNKYFPRKSLVYPDGTIVKVKNNPKIWLIENGKKRLFANWSSFISRFSPQQIVNINNTSLEHYSDGKIIKFANYSVVQTPNKQLYLLVDDTKRPFASKSIFKKMGFNPEEIEQASLADLENYKTGKIINAKSNYPLAALLEDKKTHKIYYVQDGQKALVDKILLNIKFPYQKIIKVDSNELKHYTTKSPILLGEGTLVKTTSFPMVYLISGGKKRPFINQNIFSKLGYKYSNVISVPSRFLYNYDKGAPIK